jgi:hypothetical protein
METQSSYSFHLFFKQWNPLRLCVVSVLLLLDLQLDLVVHGVGPVLLVLSGWRLPGHHLHLHSARQKQLLLVLERVDSLGRSLCRAAYYVRLNLNLLRVMVRQALGRHRSPLRLLVVVLVELVDV